MTSCPTCRAGLFQHSVLIPRLQAERGVETPTYARCFHCGTGGRRDSPDTFVVLVERDLAALGPMLWIRPPWAAATVAADFELSWDLVEYFFLDLARTGETSPHGLAATAVRMPRLVAELRAAGYGPRLRAGQSVHRLLLSRSREHGLRDGQSYLGITPHGDGLLQVRGSIGGTPIAGDAVPSTLTPWLDTQLEALAGVPVD